jgi:ABC-type transporter Mla subunit MlaD
MYLDITSRGTPSGGLATKGGPLPAAQTQVSVPVSDVLDVFQPDVRAHITDVLNNLGAGLSDNGDALRVAFVKLVPFLDVVWRMSQQLAVRRVETRRLVSNFGALMGDLGQRQQDLRRLVSEGGTMFGAMARSSPNLDATLRELPPTLADISSSFSATRAVLPPLDEALQRLEPVATELPQGLGALRGLSATARPALDALERPVQRLVPFSQALAPTSAALQSMAAALNPQTTAVDHITTSIAGCPKALYGFFQWTPSVFSVEDARGVTVRGDLALGLDSSGGVHDPNVYTPASCAPGVPYPARP